MICLECVNGLIREMPGKKEVVCCLDSRLVMGIFKCNFFFRAVDDRPIVEGMFDGNVMPSFHVKQEVAPEKIEEVSRETVGGIFKRGRGRPRKV